MSRSSSEREIRDAVVARLRQAMPGARIIHELNVAGQGTNRIDVVAVDRQAIVGVEIKSEKDTLKRLTDQWAAFNKCCHRVFVAAHEKHFQEHRHEHMRDDLPGEMRLNHPDFFESWSRRRLVWPFPKPEKGFHGEAPWPFDPRRDCSSQPKASAMLEMLWADELRAECARHGLAANSRSTRPQMIAEMVWMMTGREMCEAVCRQLRGRVFTEADEPIREERAA